MDMEIIPTADCLRLLNNHGLLFRATPTGGAILFQRGSSGAVLRRINALSRFTFLLQLRNPGFDNVTRLDYPANKLGRPIYYFSNTDAAGGSDTFTELAKSTGQKVGHKDAGWLVGPVIRLPEDASGSRVDLTAMVLASGKKVIKSFGPPTAASPIDLGKLEASPGKFFRLPKGKYELEFAGSPPAVKTIYFDENLLTQPVWGIIEISKNQTVDYLAAPEYTLTFGAERWKYYLIDTDNKVTLADDGSSLTNLSASTTGLPGLSIAWVPEAEMEDNSHEKRFYTFLKNRNPGKPIFFIRSNRGMPQTAETTVKVTLTLAGTESLLPSPSGIKSKLDVIQNL